MPVSRSGRRTGALFGRATVAVTAGLAVGALVVACGGSSSASSPRAKKVTSHSTNVAFTPCAAQCSGELDGAKYSIRMPTTWNGTLLLYSHGYRFATPTPPENAPVQTGAQVSSTDSNGTGSDALSHYLLGQGYALAGSSAKSNGWAVADGVQAGVELRALFVKVVGSPDRTYVWGDSLGGLITEILAEKHPEWVDGAAPMCGAVAGPNLNFNLALDVAYAVKTLIDPALQLTGYASAAAAAADWTRASAIVQKTAADVTGGGTAKVLLIAALADAPTQTETFDGADLTSQVKARVESILTALAFGTSGRYELEQRVHGNPSSNVGVDYSTRISTDERSLITLAGGNVDALLAQLKTGPRTAADPAATAAFEALGDTTGQIAVPTVTMHTEADPLVVVQNESILAERAKAKGRSSELVQLFIKAPATYSEKTGAPYGAGHCNFSDGQREGLIATLDRWVRSGKHPVPTDLGSTIGAGLDPSYMPSVWPAAT